MIALSVGTAVAAHGIHVVILVIGGAGLLALLAPRLLGAALPTGAEDEHSRRVRIMQDQIASVRYTLLTGERSAPLPAAATTTTSGLVPVAVVSSAAAAGVHAGVSSAHFAASVVVGLFFAGAALAQILWAMAFVLRPTRALLRAAIAGNATVLGLWWASRTVGLPGIGTEPFGPWDLACALWELTAVLASARLLLPPGPIGTSALRLPPWTRWPISARAWAYGSAVALGLLAISGPGA